MHFSPWFLPVLPGTCCWTIFRTSFGIGLALFFSTSVLCYLALDLFLQSPQPLLSFSYKCCVCLNSTSENKLFSVWLHFCNGPQTLQVRQAAKGSDISPSRIHLLVSLKVSSKGCKNKLWEDLSTLCCMFCLSGVGVSACSPERDKHHVFELQQKLLFEAPAETPLVSVTPKLIFASLI